MNKLCQIQKEMPMLNDKDEFADLYHTLINFYFLSNNLNNY